MLVCSDAMVPGGRVRRRPGLRARKRTVVARRSVLVRTIPIALAMREYTRKNTRAWKKMVILSVPILPKEILEPFVLRIRPGLRARKRAVGMATFWDVMSEIIYIKSIFLSHTKNIPTKLNEIPKGCPPQ